MSYVNLANAQVRKAFVTLKDLAVEAVFNKKNVSGFNFATQAVQSTSEPAITTKIVVLKTEQPSKKSQVITKTFMVKKSDVTKLDLYTTVQFEGHTWKFGEVIRDSGYIIVTTMFRVP
jgi:hypothetical protein